MEIYTDSDSREMDLVDYLLMISFVLISSAISSAGTWGLFVSIGLTCYMLKYIHWRSGNEK